MAAKSKSGLARIRASDVRPALASQALSQANTPGAMSRMNDTLVNLMTGMGTEKDKTQGTVFGYNLLGKGQLDSAYRGDWISRKAIDIPAFDSFRAWRTWQADKNDISAIEDVEKGLRLLKKSMAANIRGRLYGGGALIMGVDQGKSDEELIIDKVGKDQLKFVHPVTRWDLSMGEIDWDPMSPYFGEPKYYTMSGKMGGVALKIHPSRVVRFLGAEPADINLTDGWGDSILQICADAIIACGTVAASVAQLIAEAKIDIVKMPELSEKIINTAYEDRLKKRFGLASTMKSVFGMLIVDKEEEWQRIDQNFAGLPDLLKMYLLVVTGAVDVPATRFLGQSPQGLNATGDSDIRNYYDRVSTEQNIMISPAMERLDRVLVRSALGQEPDGIFYDWNPLWQMTETEAADVAVKKAQVMTADVNAGLITPLVMQKARENQLIEDGIYPGLESLIEDFGDDVDERQAAEQEEAAAAAQAAAAAASQSALNPAANENQPAPGEPSRPPIAPRRTAGGTPAPAATPPTAAPAARGKAVGDGSMNGRIKKGAGKRKRMDDASTPRSLYVRRDVQNVSEIKAWAKAQGFKSVLDDLHVTIMYSKTAVDWLKIGTDEFTSSNDSGELIVKAGGPRVMERFGKAIVLAFSNSDLQYRHRSMMCRGEADGISWEHDDYTPHVTITYDGGDIDLMSIEAYTGEIKLGPEIFEEVKSDFQPEETDT
jgi:phage-related protein (TIGR01555 family)